jgi:hypothetical protein
MVRTRTYRRSKAWEMRSQMFLWPRRCALAKCVKTSGRCVLYNAATKDQRGLYWLVINQPAPAR